MGGRAFGMGNWRVWDEEPGCLGAAIEGEMDRRRRSNMRELGGRPRRRSGVRYVGRRVGIEVELAAWGGGGR